MKPLLALQLFNAVFIGIVAGIGMLWFQDLMPGRAGSATTLFTNSISTGVILAGVIQGALCAELWACIGVLGDRSDFARHADADVPGKRRLILEGGFTK